MNYIFIKICTEMAKKGMKILLSNSCLVLPAVVKQQQEEISRNHVPSLFAVSVHWRPLIVPQKMNL